jgi:hypothetical protein
VTTAQRPGWKGIDDPPRRSVLAAWPNRVTTRRKRPGSAASHGAKNCSAIPGAATHARLRLEVVGSTGEGRLDPSHRYLANDGRRARCPGIRCRCSTAPRPLLPIPCSSQRAMDCRLMPYSTASRDFDSQVHGHITAPAHPSRANDADLGRRLAAWPRSMPSRWRSWMSAPLDLCEGPHRQQRIRHRRIWAGDDKRSGSKSFQHSLAVSSWGTPTEITDVGRQANADAARNRVW